MNHRYRAIVPAAGIGLRMGTDRPKQYLSLCGRPVLRHTLEKLHGIDEIDSIMVMLRSGDPWFSSEFIEGLDRVSIVEGGAERCDSVRLGLEAMQTDVRDGDWILVHDAVRPCIARADILSLLETLSGDPVGGLLASPVRETLKRVDATGHVRETVDRSGIWTAATPQLFRYGLLLDALRSAAEAGLTMTDEAAAIEWAGYRPRVVEGSPDNLKITHPADLMLAERILAMQYGHPSPVGAAAT